MIRAGAVAKLGMVRNSGLKMVASRNSTPVVIAVRPVRPPSVTPEALSTKVVGGGSTQHSAHAGADGVCHQCALDVGQTAVLVQHISLGGHADQGAQRVEQVHEEEGEHHGEEVQQADTGEVGLEHLTKGLAQSREIELMKLVGMTLYMPASGLGM